MRAAPEHADLVVLARGERLIEAKRGAVLEVARRGRPVTAADDARAQARILNELLDDLRHGRHHTLAVLPEER
jgi:hypothetical protein